MITNNELDLGVLECFVRGLYLVRRILQVNPIVVICNRENPLASMDHLHIQDLAHENFLMREAYSDTRVAVDSAFQNYKIDVQPSWESSSSLTLLNAVKENLGIAFLPPEYCKRLLRPGHRDPRRRRVYAYLRSQFHSSQR